MFSNFFTRNCSFEGEAFGEDSWFEIAQWSRGVIAPDGPGIVCLFLVQERLGAPYRRNSHRLFTAHP